MATATPIKPLTLTIIPTKLAQPAVPQFNYVPLNPTIPLVSAPAPISVPPPPSTEEIAVLQAREEQRRAAQRESTKKFNAKTKPFQKIALIQGDIPKIEQLVKLLYPQLENKDHILLAVETRKYVEALMAL